MNIKYILIILSFLFSLPLAGQTDEDPPASPLFTFVTIDQVSGRTEMTWTLSSSPDVAGYVIYLFDEGEGYAIDTIFDPDATSYSVLRPGTTHYSESYVIAAIDSSGNISPLSNELHTIFTELIRDTCNNRINILWNRYSSAPVKVTGYDVYVSVNGGTYFLARHFTADATSFEYEEIASGSEYCFRVNAILENGLTSGSNMPCAAVKMVSPPQWINADFATVTEEGAISLSFSIDPSSETDLYILERKIGYSGSFQQIAPIRSEFKTITFPDQNAAPDVINFYRLSALNSCNVPVATSNIASNIVLNAQNTGSEVVLQWNPYRDWNGSIASYRLFTDKGSGFFETELINPSDTIFRISISEIMYALTQGNVCFYITASESGNPYGITGETRSNQICSEIEEIVTVPNIFTPDGDQKNDFFLPVLTFTPAEYRLIISNRQGRVLFETRDFLEEWDGSYTGQKVPEGVYLWFLRIKSPTGKTISRTGTITVVKK